MALNVCKNLITPEAVKGVLNTGKDFINQEGTNYLGNKASDYLKDKIGFCMLRKASQKQLEALARAHSIKIQEYPNLAKQNAKQHLNN